MDPDLKTSCGVEARAGAFQEGTACAPMWRGRQAQRLPPSWKPLPWAASGRDSGDLERGRRKVLREHSCSSEAGSQMAEAVGLAHMVSRGLGPERGHRGPRTTGLQGGGTLFTDLLVMKLSPEERLRGDWPAQPP